MYCLSIKKGVACILAKKEGGCEMCQTIVEKCQGCNRVVEFDSKKYCNAYIAPAQAWKLWDCNLASHLEVEKDKNKKKINPIKMSKRSSKKGR